MKYRYDPLPHDVGENGRIVCKEREDDEGFYFLYVCRGGWGASRTTVVLGSS